MRSHVKGVKKLESQRGTYKSASRELPYMTVGEKKPRKGNKKAITAESFQYS